MTPIRLAAAGLVLLSAPALGQQPVLALAQGRPDGMAQSTLAPHPPRVTVTAPGDVPMNRWRLPQGFRVELGAHGMPGARMMALGDQGGCSSASA